MVCKHVRKWYVRECTYTLDSKFLFCPTTESFGNSVTSVAVLTITDGTAKDTGLAEAVTVEEDTVRTGPVRDAATGLRLFVLIFFFICITAPVDVVAFPWNEKVEEGRVEEEEEVAVENPKPTVVTPSLAPVVAVEEEEEEEELDDDDDEVPSSLSSVCKKKMKKVKLQKEWNGRIKVVVRAQHK